MTIQIPLSPEQESELHQQAAALGKDIVSLIQEAVEEKLAALEDDAAARITLSREQRIAEWLAWTASHRPLGYVVDDSRETIYAGRGE